jgi:phosphatidylglycerol:prolipoprotein diacylglycerol transferase
MFPLHLDFGFKVIHFYEGFYFLVSLLVGAWLVVLGLRKARLDAAVFLNNLTWVLLGAVLGARVFHFLFWDVRAVLADPLGFFRLWEGGLSITGGLAGGGLSAFLCFRKARVDFWRYFAAGSPGVLVGQALGRVGCFLNGDAWGTPTGLPWGVALPRFGLRLPGLVVDPSAPSDAWLWSVGRGSTSPYTLKTVPLHPVQLYECLGDLVLAGLVLLLARSLARTRGPWSRVLWLHLGGYALLRFGLEFLHGDRDVTVWAGMTALQLGLAAFGALSLWLYLRASTDWRKTVTNPSRL